MAEGRREVPRCLDVEFEKRVEQPEQTCEDPVVASKCIRMAAGKLRLTQQGRGKRGGPNPHMMVHVQNADPAAKPDISFDLDYMMESLVQGRGDWVYEKTWPAAEAGLAKAQLMMGILYQLGIGVEQNGQEAVRFYRAAAAQNNPLAWRNLATLYLLGLAGVGLDKAEAHRCFSQARLLETEQMAREQGWEQTVH